MVFTITTLMFTKEAVTLYIIAELLECYPLADLRINGKHRKGGDYLMAPRDLRLSVVV